MFNVIYYIIFAILTTLLIIYIENKYSGAQQSTKVVEIDGIQYIVPDVTIKEQDPIIIKNIGSKLVCESMEEIMGQKIKYNSFVPEAKSMISGDYLYSDCYEPNTQIMADYKPQNMYTYEGRDSINHDFYDFYNRLALDALKVDKIKKLNYNYIEVPSTVDVCEIQNGKMWCDENKPYSERKKKIKEYLNEKIVNFF